MGFIAHCWLHTARSFSQGQRGKGVNTFALLQNLCVNKLLILSPRSFIDHQGHASPDFKEDQLPNIKDKKEGAFDEDDHMKKISDILNCSVKKAQLFCVKHDFLNIINIDTMQERVQLMLSYGVPYSVIQTNLRAVWHVSTRSLTQRLQLLQKLSLLNHKHVGFYLYCTKKEFEQGVSYVQENKEALDGCANLLEYTQHRLNVNEVEARKFLSNSPFQRGYSPIRMKRHFDFFFFDAKVNSHYILQHFVLFNYSPERLRYRLKIMRRAGINESCFWKKFWRCTSRDFHQIFSKHIEETGS